VIDEASHGRGLGDADCTSGSGYGVHSFETRVAYPLARLGINALHIFLSKASKPYPHIFMVSFKL